jgi:hypothetical protein
VAKDTNLLAEVLGILKDVGTFYFAAYPWCDLPKKLRTGICDFCRQSSLFSLTLIGLGPINELAEFYQLVASPALKDLFLQKINLPAPNENERLATNRPQLRECIFDLPSSSLDVMKEWLVDGDTLSELHHLGTVCGEETESQLRSIMNAPMPRLRQLTLRVRASEFIPQLHLPLI